MGYRFYRAAWNADAV